MMVSTIDPDDAESIVDGAGKMICWSARRIDFPGCDEPVIVIIYNAGPSQHGRLVEQRLDGEDVAWPQRSGAKGGA